MERGAVSAGGIRAADLFCGVGGLTYGLRQAGVDVRLGVDLDPACEYPYEANNDAPFMRAGVETISGDVIKDAWGEAEYRLLAGCAPCQPFSTYSQGRDHTQDGRWFLLDHFARLVEETSPDFVTMENVPRLRDQAVFSSFVAKLEALAFTVTHQVVHCADYGVPQDRRRLVLMASRHGSVELIAPTTPQGKRRTVRDAIGGLPPLVAGEMDGNDRLHQCAALTEVNLRRIRHSKPGGNWREWPEDLVLACHRKQSGERYGSVYGRMSWDGPSPTMTTQFFGYGNGRFGHPEQDRALSLREGAVLQSFPKNYRFVKQGDPILVKEVGRLIGNAVPVKLGEAIGRSFAAHARGLRGA